MSTTAGFTEFVRSGRLRAALGLGAHSPTARAASRGSSAVPIDSIERMVMVQRAVTGVDHTITSTTFADVDPTLSWTFVVSGRRPVSLHVQALGGIGAGNMCLSLAIDGVEVTGAASVGMARVDAGTQTLTGEWAVDLTPGQHTVSVVARVSGGSGTIYGTGYIYVRAMEE